MSLLGALRRIENGADMWLASNDGSTSNYSKAESMLRAFSGRHDVLISDSQRGIKYEFKFHDKTVKIFINPNEFAIETWKATDRIGLFEGKIEDAEKYKYLCGILASYNKP